MEDVLRKLCKAKVLVVDPCTDTLPKARAFMSPVKHRRIVRIEMDRFCFWNPLDALKMSLLFGGLAMRSTQKVTKQDRMQ